MINQAPVFLDLDVNPFLICPQPISLKFLSILLLIAIFSPSLAHTGFKNWILTTSELKLITLPPNEVEPMLIMSTSSTFSFCTLLLFLSPSDLTPNNLRSKKY